MDKQYYLEMYINLYKDSVLRDCKNFNNIKSEYMSEKRIQQYLSGKSPKLAKNALTIVKYISNKNNLLHKYYCGYSYDEIQNDYYSRTGKEKRNKLKIFKQYWIDEGYSDYYAELISKENYNYGKNHKLPVSQVDKKYWIYRGYTEEKAIKKVSSIQKLNADKWISQKDTKRFKDVQTTSLNYWINKGYNEEEAKIKLSERQSTFSLKKCIEKYGVDEGRKRFNERQQKWQNSLKEKFYSTSEEKLLYNISKSQIYSNMFKHYNNVEETLYNYKLFLFTKTLKKIQYRYKNTIYNLFRIIKKYYISKKSKKKSYSISNEAINFFKTYINPIFDKYNYSYITASDKYKRTEKIIAGDNKIYFYDFCCEDLKIIIEYNGTAFHPKTIDDKNFKHPYKLNIEQIFNNDKIKKETAIKNGYINYFTIWSDYTNEELNKLIEDINEIIKNNNQKIIRKT